MGKKRKADKDTPGNLNVFHHLKKETVHTVLAIVFLILAIFLFLAVWGSAGIVGNKIHTGLTFFLGYGYFLLPILFLMLGVAFATSIHREISWIQIFGAGIFFVTGLGLVDTVSTGNAGIVGGLISKPLISMFDVYATSIFLIGALCISTLIIFDTPRIIPMQALWSWIMSYFSSETNEEEFETIKLDESNLDDEADDEEVLEEPAPTEEKEVRSDKKSWFGSKEENEVIGFAPLFSIGNTIYNPPPLSLLNRDKGKPEVGDIKAEANVIRRTLQNFGINVEMDEVSIGPSVTRYSLKPAEGVKLSRIVGLQNDLSLALAAHPIRIEAPIPGKSLVGIEIPNQKKTLVGLASLLGNNEFKSSDKPLLIGLGKSVSGHNHYANLAKMPHLLIAGATGSGKSVTIHTLVTALLYRNSPETMKFIMVDPKRVELTLYNGIPHLLTPVITTAKNAILSLKWLTKEMDRRYDILESEQVRDIQSYHMNIVEPELKRRARKAEKQSGNETEVEDEMIETMPYIVVIIDELADIMQTYPREMEASVVRLAQMSRAVGIHLVLSTQRPSVNVITGLIKANIPARIALQVASQIDSRTILDMGGAEKLLGAGDMLYLSGEMGKPLRIQSPFISEDEVKKVVKYLKENSENPGGDHIIDFTAEQKDGSSYIDTLLGKGSSDDDDDDLLEEASEIVIEAQKASTSYIQRKLRVGYARAARLIDMLEDRGVVGPADGSKARSVLVQNEENNNKNNSEFESDISTDNNVLDKD